MSDPIPTVRQFRLAQALRELRTDAQMTQEQVAARMEWHSSKLFRLENARSPRVNWLDIQGLLDLYGVASPQREALIQLAKDSRKRGWWTSYRDVFTGSYVALEDASRLMRHYCAELVPGPLQTEDYARSVIQALRPAYDKENVERRVAARMERQALLSRDRAPELVCIVNEGVLYRQVGGSDVMRKQLRSLIEASERSNITVRILPYSAGAHAAMEGPFVILSFPEDEYPDVVYIEGMMGDLYLESIEEIKRYTSTFKMLDEASASPDASVSLISKALKELP